MTPPTPAIRPIGMHELVLEVADLDAASSFYRDVIGLREVARWTGERRAVWFDTGDSVALGLWPSETGGEHAIHNARGGVHVHFALRIPIDALATVETRLKALGSDTSHIDFDDGNASVYVNDPDGNCVELMAALVDWEDNPLPVSS